VTIVRSVCFRLLIVAAVFASLPAAPCRAQGIGIGGHFSFVKGDAKSDAPSERFIGGHVRAWLSKRVGAELSLDRRSEENVAMTERVRDSPIQASLLLCLVRSSFSPYVLGGVGWYTHSVDVVVANEVTATTRTRRTGSHAGFGAELRAGRHAALHADYRYTFLHFGDDPANTTTSGGKGFLPSYEGSMWTAGVTVYF
jgi:hypothetical protein